MLNISKNSIGKRSNFMLYNSMKHTAPRSRDKVFIRISVILVVIMIGIACLPWTQNVRAKGIVTALRQDQRPQTIHSVIAGRMEKWYVSEGQFVEKGDTIAVISEIKETYLNPNLLENTNSQIGAKELSVNSYMNKVRALDGQIDAMILNQGLKTEQALNKITQARLKVQTDSADLVAAENALLVAQNQIDRTQELYDEGLKSLTDLEEKRIKYQENLAKTNAQSNKLLTSKNAYINARVAYNNIENEFADKIAKSESEKYAALSAMYEAETDLTKLQNQYVNYSIRSGLYVIEAPQSGYIAKALVSGLGETIKEGEELVSIMPDQADLAVEMYVRPIDLPLISKGQKVRIQFDGWPAIVFGGWENMSFGMFGGKIVAVDNFTSSNGLYRVLVSSDQEAVAWPEAIRVGAGAKTITMLENVPIWYELWRNINGFPPNYYEANANVSDELSQKSKKVKSK